MNKKYDDCSEAGIAAVFLEMELMEKLESIQAALADNLGYEVTIAEVIAYCACRDLGIAYSCPKPRNVAQRKKRKEARERCKKRKEARERRKKRKESRERFAASQNWDV